MSVSSISFTLVNIYAAQPVATTATGASPRVSHDEDDDDAPAGVESSAGGRHSVLYDAMMSALKDLGFLGQATAPAASSPSTAPTSAPATATPAAPSTTTPGTPAASNTSSSGGTSSTAPAGAASSTGTPTPAAATTTATAVDGTSDSSEVREAVFSFAHALYGALHSGDQDASAPNKDHGARLHRQSHRHDHDHGYRGLAHRLEALAASLTVASAGAAPSGPTGATAPAPSADPAAAAPTTASTTASTSTPADSPANATASPTASAATTSPHAPAAASNTKKLVDAFSALLATLSHAAPTNAPASDVKQRLSSFLHQVAQGLMPGTAQGALAAVGTLVNVTA